MTSGTRLAAGRTAEVYSWSGDRVVKLFRDGFPQEWIDREAVNSREVTKKGLPTPPYFETIQHEGRTGIVYQRIRGSVLLSEITRQPWKVRSLARDMAALHTVIHRADGSGLPHQRPVLERAIDSCDRLAPGLKKRVLEVLASLPDGTALCHFDFHPDQIIVTDTGPFVIDWMTAVRGNPVADLARTLVILQFGYPPNTNWIMLRLIDLMRSQLRGAYLKHYLALRPEVDRGELAAWMIPLAAARLADGLPEEEAPIIDYLVRSLDQVEHQRQSH